MAVGSVGSTLPPSTRFGTTSVGPGSATRGQAPSQTAGGQAPASPQVSPLTSAIQTVSAGIDEMNSRLDGLIGALTSFMQARNGGQPDGQTTQAQPASPDGTPSGTQAPGSGQSPGPAPGPGGSVSVDEAGDININIVINVEPPGAAPAPAPGPNPAPSPTPSPTPASAPPAPVALPDAPVKVEIIQPPPPPPPPPVPTSVVTSDFGSVTINGKQTFLGTVFGIFFTPPEAANYIVGVLNTNPDNGGIEAATAGDGRIVLTSKTGGQIRIDDIQAESDGDILNNALMGFTKGQTGNGTLTGEVVSLFDPTKVDTSDPNRPPVLRE